MTSRSLPASTEFPSNPRCSIVIPVYNSAEILGETINRTVKACEVGDIDFELILVNDGSRDESWTIAAGRADSDPRIVAVDLLKNYGQHTAVFAGLRLSVGRYVITMDDDLQNPPEEIARVLQVAESGRHDLVIGKFVVKQHSLWRRFGSRIISWMNRRVFDKPKDLEVTNFRCIRRDVVERMIEYHTAYPYITGLALMFSRYRTNVEVEHHPRTAGESGYGARKMGSVVFRLLFNYSSFPLRAVSTFGLIITMSAFLLTTFIFIRALLVGRTVPGWTSVALMVSFFNGVMLLISSMLGEYVVRLLNQSSHPHGYHIRTIVRSDV